MDIVKLGAAAFGRLCVETDLVYDAYGVEIKQPPSGGCVLKLNSIIKKYADKAQPPSGGCVLKHDPPEDESQYD